MRQKLRLEQLSEWSSWYETAIPMADDLCDAYLIELRNEGLICGTNQVA